MAACYVRIIQLLPALIVLLLSNGCTPKTLQQRPEAALSTGSGGEALAAVPSTYRYFYGLYAAGSKIGTLRAERYVEGQQLVLAHHLQGRIGGMGKVQAIELSEQRRYQLADGKLTALSFVQQAGDSKVLIAGHCSENGIMQLQVNAGGHISTVALPCEEQLTDSLAIESLAKDGQVGQEKHTKHLDPSVQQVLAQTHRIEAIEQRLMAGINVPVKKIITIHPSIGTKEEAWTDSTGKVLESQFGGMFVMKLEPEAIAKQLDAVPDLLIQSTVQVPAELQEQTSLSSLLLLLQAPAETIWPTSARQQLLPAEKSDPKGTIRMLLRLDETTGSLPFSLATPLVWADPNLLALVQATPFLQSDAPSLRQAARQAVAGATTIWQATEQLVHFVHGHMKPEYVPAYSNALEAFERAGGDCTEYSALFVALARAVGIPARVAVGLIYWPPGKGLGWHAWAEVWLGNRFIAVDPTWDQPIADVTHVKLAEGDPSEQLKVGMLMGRLKVLAWWPTRAAQQPSPAGKQ